MAPADDVGDQLSGEQRSAARDHPRPEPKLATARLLLLLLRVLLRVLLLVVAILVVVVRLAHQAAHHAAQSPLASLGSLPASTLDLAWLVVAPGRRIGHASRVQELCSLSLVVAPCLPSLVDGLCLLRMDLSLCKAGVGPGSGGRVCGRVDVKVCLVAGIELSDPWRGEIPLVALGSWRCHCGVDE